MLPRPYIIFFIYFSAAAGAFLVPNLFVPAPPDHGTVLASLHLLDALLSSTAPFWFEMIFVHAIRESYIRKIESQSPTMGELVTYDDARRLVEFREYCRTTYQCRSGPLAWAAVAAWRGEQLVTFEERVEHRAGAFKTERGRRPNPNEQQQIWRKIAAKARQPAEGPTILAKSAQQAAKVLISSQVIITILIVALTVSSKRTSFCDALVGAAMRYFAKAIISLAALGFAVVVKATAVP